MLGQLLTWKVTDHKISGVEIKETRRGKQEQQAEWKATNGLSLLAAAERF